VLAMTRRSLDPTSGQANIFILRKPRPQAGFKASPSFLYKEESDADFSRIRSLSPELQLPQQVDRDVNSL
jgi:hypothetical protein